MSGRLLREDRLYGLSMSGVVTGFDGHLAMRLLLYLTVFGILVGVSLTWRSVRSSSTQSRKR